jgi:CIC family chloride channel protein
MVVPVSAPFTGKVGDAAGTRSARSAWVALPSAEPLGSRIPFIAGGRRHGSEMAFTSPRPEQRSATLVLALAVPIGLLAAVVALGFREAITGLHWLLTHDRAGMVDTAMSLGWWQRLLVPLVGGLAAGGILAVTRRLTAQRPADYLEAITVGDGSLDARSTILRSASSLFSVASGGSIGREGPMVQLGALVASWIGQAVGPLEQRQLLVGCGAAAGIAAVYNAPLAGVLFVGEIVIGSIALERLAPVIVSSVISSVTIRQFQGGPIYGTPSFELLAPIELVPYALLGVAAGIVGPWFLRVVDLARAGFAATRLPLTLRLGLGGLLVGLVSVWVPQVSGNGYSVVTSLLAEPWLWTTVLMLLVFKILATAATVGSGAVGGVFTPTLFVGAALGSLWGAPWHALDPQRFAEPNAYALVGMGAVLAATTQAPFMSILMIFEMTVDARILLPLMLACVLAAYLARASGARPAYAVRREPADQALPTR